MKKCLIISGGENCLDQFPDAFFDDFDFIIGCDQGFEYGLERNVNFNLVLGDFDSVKNPKLLVNAKSHAKEIQTFPKEKDDTDTMLAVKSAIQKGFSQISIVCALGNRLDHTISNLQTAIFAARHNSKVEIYGRDEIIYAFSNSELEIPKKSGYSLSVFSADVCTGVTIQGAKYSVRDITLKNDFPLGQSNDWTDQKSVKISVKNGTLLVILSKIR